jgi:serine/threonine-protein kinase
MLTRGNRLGVYEVVASIGAGGMGEVYRARDTRLDRDVAIKILPEPFGSDPERVARFAREAKTLAALNHPNIAHIYGVEESNGTNAIVMELVEGETLADRIARGPIPIDEALPIAKQIAEALEAAHEQGIIHRDLKPANIKIRPDGTVKVLDFGLAKLTESTSVSTTNPTALSMSPTITAPALMSGVGVLLGTAAYMSPEQAKGGVADKRSDIWALGCVVYEMLTGKAAFAESTVTETLAAILKSDTDWSKVPRSLHAVLGRCLHKDPKQRWRAAGDVAIELELTAENARRIGGSARSARVPLRTTAALIVTCVAAGSLMTVGVMRFARRPMPASIVTRFAFPIEAARFTGTGRRLVAISPDGSQIAYTADDQLWLRRSNELNARPIPGTVFARPAGTGQSLTNPFFSPDGQWIGFWSSADATLKKVATTGGAPVTICAASNVNGASWSDDLIVFGQENRGIVAVSANGGTPQVIAATTAGELADGPQILPGGYVMFSIALTAQGAARWDTATVVATPLKGGPRTTILRGGHAARYLPSGHLVYAVGGNLLAVPFDVERLRITGGPVPVLEDAGESNGGAVGAAPTGAVHFDISQTGTLAYVPRAAVLGGAARLSIMTLDRKGGEHALDIPPQPFLDPRFSPDGDRIALSNAAEGNDVWTYDVRRGTLARQTFEVGEDETPTWSPDGKWIAYTSIRSDQRTLFRRRSDGTGPEEILWSAPLPAHAHVQDWTSAGILIALDKNDTGGHYELYLFSLGEHSLKPLLQAAFNQTTARVSPDGRWLAYASNESGRYEVYVRPFPSQAGKWQVSTTGGSRPVWSRRGDELFFRGGRSINAVRVTSNGGSFSTSAPFKLFDDRYDDGNLNHTNYDVSLDGERFVMFKPAEASSGQPGGQIVAVQNWLDEVRRMIPAAK